MIKSFKGKMPQLQKTNFIAENATLIGDILLKESASIWYGAVIRADYEPITIGVGTNIQDLAMVHTNFNAPTMIGDYCTIGHTAIIHGCSIGDCTLIGMGATILDNAKIGNYCIVGANSLVTANTVIPDYSMVLGSPAKVVRPLKPNEIEQLKENALHYMELATHHQE